MPNMRYLRRKLDYKDVIGVSMGKNRSTDAARDYAMGVKVFSPTANYLVVNMISSSVDEFKDLHRKEKIREILIAVVKARLLFDVEKQRPIFLQLQPELSGDEIKEIVQVSNKKECRVDGFIISDGKPAEEKSTKVIEEVYKLTKGAKTIISVGSVTNGREAYERILAGASVVEINSSFAYHGFPVVTKIKRELHDILVQNGYTNVNEAVGKGVKLERRKFFFFS